MNKLLLRKDQISICHKNSCVIAAGENAKMISVALAIMFILMGYVAVKRSA